MFKYCCEDSNYKMSTTQNVILRVAIVLAMLVAVAAILYLTPLPEKHFKSCDRPCHDLDWPMICRVKLLLELTKNNSITINGQTSGPSIQICQNDVLVVDVINQIQGHSVSVHWRGQLNNEYPYMDGVPLVTQCPIPSYTTFQYKFRASTSGTHSYHAFSDQDRTRGLFGALVVREPDRFEPHRRNYDSDLKNHTILIGQVGNFLSINGKVGTEVFKVKRNRRYRFRVVFMGGEGCPVTLSVDNHKLRVIGLDGSPLNPVEVDSVVFGKGERVDFVLKTNQENRNHFLRVKSCNGDGVALMDYDGIKRDVVEEKPKIEKVSFNTAVCEERLCLGGVRSLEEIPEKLKTVDKVIYLSFGSRVINVNDKSSYRIYSINNLTFTYPPSPLLTQLSQISLGTVCDQSNIPEKCRGQEACECVHVEYIPLDSSVELILINQDEEEHVFHFHGYRFYVIGRREFPEVPGRDEVKSLDRENRLFKRNFDKPMRKDTVRVNGKSVVALRFLASNPGFWMFRDEKSKGWTRGMDIVFQVGDSADMVSAPTDFPTCGNYIGPDFFLM